MTTNTIDVVALFALFLLAHSLPTRIPFPPLHHPNLYYLPRARPPLCLSSKEVRERRFRGQCLYCPEKYFPGHICATPYLLLLDAAAVSKAVSKTPVEDLPPASDEVLLEATTPITINSLESPKRICGRVMRLLGHIGDLPIRAFADSGADLNFLNPSVTTRMGLRIDHSLIEHVTVANDRLCYTTSFALNVSV